MATIISLAPGQNSFYDSVSGIHLTAENKEVKVSSNANMTGLLRAVKAGKILVVSGSLESDALAYQESLKAVPTYFRLLAKKQKQIVKQNIVKTTEIVEPIKETIKEVIIEPTKVLEKEAEIKETVVPEIAKEETIVEITPKKRTKKKKEVEVKED